MRTMTSDNCAMRLRRHSKNAPAMRLQRKCACGNHTMSGECEQCKKKDGLLRRASFSPRGRGTEGEGAVPLIVYEVLRSPGQPLDPATRAFMEPRFDHDFTRVPTHGAAMRSAQRQLGINGPNDSWEQDADRTAERIMRAAV